LTTTGGAAFTHQPWCAWIDNTEGVDCEEVGYCTSAPLTVGRKADQAAPEQEVALTVDGAQIEAWLWQSDSTQRVCLMDELASGRSLTLTEATELAAVLLTLVAQAKATSSGRSPQPPFDAARPTHAAWCAWLPDNSDSPEGCREAGGCSTLEIHVPLTVDDPGMRLTLTGRTHAEVPHPFIRIYRGEPSADDRWDLAPVEAGILGHYLIGLSAVVGDT